MFSTILSTFWDWIKGVASVITVISFFIEFTPIKLHPISFVCSKLGSAFNKELKKEIENLKTEVKDLSDKVQKTEDSLTEKINENDTKQTERYMKQLRGNILNFSNSCMNHEHHTKDEFEHIIEAHQDYEDILEELGLSNGVVTLEFEYIKDVYHKCCKENSFL